MTETVLHCLVALGYFVNNTTCDILQYVFNDTYARYVKNIFDSMFFMKTGCDGVIDSIRTMGIMIKTKRQFLKRLLLAVILISH